MARILKREVLERMAESPRRRRTSRGAMMLAITHGQRIARENSYLINRYLRGEDAGSIICDMAFTEIVQNTCAIAAPYYAVRTKYPDNDVRAKIYAERRERIKRRETRMQKRIPYNGKIKNTAYGPATEVEYIGHALVDGKAFDEITADLNKKWKYKGKNQRTIGGVRSAYYRFLASQFDA